MIRNDDPKRRGTTRLVLPTLGGVVLALAFAPATSPTASVAPVAVGASSTELTAPDVGQTPESKFSLPELHQIRSVTLGPSYSCRSKEEFERGYGTTALFLSDYARDRNAPDLLFNGACGAANVFEAATAGDDMSLIADLGDGISLNELSASQAFNVRRVAADSAYSKFARVARVEQGHSYAVLLNASDKRGLFVFSVSEYVPDAKVTLRYAVKSYAVTPRGQVSSPGFHWDRGNGR